MQESPVQRKRASFIYSIRFRLVLWFTVILALVLAAFASFIYFNQARDIRGNASFQMEQRMELIIRSLPSGSVPSNLLGDEDIFLLMGPNGNVIASHGVDSEQEGVNIAQNRDPGTTQTINSREGTITSWISNRGDPQVHYIFIARPVSINGEPGAAILGTPFDPYGLYNRLLFTLLGGSLLTLAIALGGGLWLADRAMRPVRTITQTAREISATDLGRRMNLGRKDELGELADTFDAMLERLDAAFTRQRQFVADASHELRTPLTIVNLEADRALANRRSAGEYRQALNVIRGENNFMTNLVEDLLTLARMDSGPQRQELELLDLSDVAVEAVERLLPLAKRNGVKLEAGTLPVALINADRQLILQMLSNLLENGIKYAGGAGHSVAVETGVDDGQAWLKVSDDGPGIPSEHLPHLFDRFYQVDQARTRGQDEDAPAGSGLGLSIVQSIVQVHGGELRVQSAPGEGTVFEARFPLAQ